jgi:YHS domain-containing protein
MNLGKLIKTLFYSFITIFLIGSMVAYFYGITPTSFGLHSKVYTSSKIAMDGYDIVNYYLKRTANKGDVTFNYKLNDNNWFFTSSYNKKAFEAKPHRYMPQYGGYCTYMMSLGFTYPPDPKIWRMHNGKLYFFKDQEAKDKAIADWNNVIAQAKLHWK